MRGCAPTDTHALADGGFNATLRDYARFGQMLPDSGGGIVPADWIEATRNHTHTAGHNAAVPEGFYHNQFWIEDDRARNPICSGVFGQLIYVSWETGTEVVKLSTWPEFVSDAYSVATLEAIGHELTPRA